MKKYFSITFLFLFLYSGILCSTEIVILHTNDLHGHPLKYNYNGMPDAGGYPALSTLVKAIRSEHKNILLLDAGDINTGRPESNFFKAEPDIMAMNYIGYDAVTFGNHEFDNPLSVLETQMKNAKFKFVSANVRDSKGKLLTIPYIINAYEGIRVAVFGLTLKETETIGTPSVVKDILFEDEIECAKKLLPELKTKADIVIALTHLGIFENENEGSKRLAKQVPGIDLIIDGHSHTYIKEPIKINNTYIVQAECWGLYLGVGKFEINNKKIESFKWEANPINLKKAVKKSDGTTAYEFIDKEIKEDRTLLAKLKVYSDKVDAILLEKIGTAEGSFDNSKTRFEETALGDIIADAIKNAVKEHKVDFALQNGGSIRSGIAKGEILKKNIFEMLPYDNSIIVLSMKGESVKRLFDYTATITPGKGAFPQVSSGVTFTINYKTKSADDILINGSPLDPAKTYRIAVNSYLASGGDGYKIFKESLDTYDTSLFDKMIFIDYIKNFKGPIKPEIKNRIKIIKETSFRFEKTFSEKAA